MLGLRCCTGFSPVAVHRLLIAVASLVLNTGARVQGFSGSGSWAPEHRLNSCGTWAELLRGIWDPPRSGIEPVSPASAGGFFTTEPPGKSRNPF